LTSWASGKNAAIYVTVINPLQDSVVTEAVTTPGHSLSIAHQRKPDKSWEACHRQGIVFSTVPKRALILGTFLF